MKAKIGKVRTVNFILIQKNNFLGITCGNLTQCSSGQNSPREKGKKKKQSTLEY
jgi:hypothetical protein